VLVKLEGKYREGNPATDVNAFFALFKNLMCWDEWWVEYIHICHTFTFLPRNSENADVAQCRVNRFGDLSSFVVHEL
jgi:hypothetical protein